MKRKYTEAKKANRVSGAGRGFLTVYQISVAERRKRGIVGYDAEEYDRNHGLISGVFKKKRKGLLGLLPGKRGGSTVRPVKSTNASLANV